MNGLAVEFDRDRRTVAKALAEVPPDGRLKGHKAWFLSTALPVLEDLLSRSRRPDDDDHFGPLWHFASRVDGWEEIYSREKRTRTIEEIAGEYRVEPEAVLVWLRAGMPYVQEGDWRTGGGFVLRPAWVFDWVLALLCLETAPGQQPAGRKLRLPQI